MDISNLSNAEILTMSQTDDKETLRYLCNELEQSFSGNSGVDSLKSKIAEALESREEPEKKDPTQEALNKMILEKEEEEAAALKELEEAIQKPETAEKIDNAYLLSLKPHEIKDVQLRRRAIRAQALRLVRVRITNLDPADSAVPGAIVTCYSKYTGKVGKYIPFDADYYANGYHVPQIILDDLRTRQFTLRKEVKKRGSHFGVKEYKSVPTRKFSIEELPPLSAQEIRSLAETQAATGAISRD